MFTGKKRMRSTRERGYAMLSALVVASVAGVFLYRELLRSGVSATSLVATEQRGENYVAAEQGFNQALTWLRSNSTGLAMQYSRSNFYTNFTRSATPSVGGNDTSPVQVPSRVKTIGGSNSVQLTNDASLGTSNFPTATDTVTGTTFNPVSSFNAISFGTQKVKISLMDAPPGDATKDYGPPPALPPATDFTPMYRIEAMNETDRGAHIFGIVAGSLVADFGMGFYGRDVLELGQPCDSYLSNNGPYTNASRRANCSAGTSITGRVHQSEQLYGTLRSNGNINQASPWGGEICSDFIAGCPNKGQTCEGASCAVPALPTYSAWNTYCPVNQGNQTISAHTTITAGNTAATRCWNGVTVNSNKVLTLSTTTDSYFIDTFNIANNSTVAFNPSPGAGTINLYVRKFTGDQFNGNQVFNLNNKPYQLRIHYLGTDPLTMNGSAQINAFLIAPYAPVTVSGNFVYQGGIKATALYATGSGLLRYDESGDITTISDITYRIKSVQAYMR